MHEYYLTPFRSAIKEAKAASMMTAYNEVNGIPMMLHPILKDIVKKEWGLDGHVVTDGADFLQTVNSHHYFESHAETLMAALKNGADSMTDDPEAVISAVMEALEKKLINETELDESLERILSVRFRLGQFDPPNLCPYETVNQKIDFNKLAMEAVRKSVVLLKNEGNLLPLRPSGTKGTIAVIGPLADTVYQDWYAGHPPYTCTPLEGLREVYGDDRIVYTDCRSIVSFTTEDGRPLILLDDKKLAVGEAGQSPVCFYMEDWGWGALTFTDKCGLLLETPFLQQEQGAYADYAENFVSVSAKNSLSWFATTLFNITPQENDLILIRSWDNRRLASPQTAGPVLLRNSPLSGSGELFRMKVEHDGMSDAVKTASKAEQVIFIGGNNPMINGREDFDRPGLSLPLFQEDLLCRIAAVNSKTILVLVSGYPFTCKKAAAQVSAVLWMAHGLQESGRGLVSLISGSHSPAGRLPLTWYEDEKQLPSIMEYDIISTGSTYQYFSGKTLWPFGHGLSYSNFEYSDLTINKTSIRKDDTIIVSFKLKNCGSIEAEEVPQLYIAVSGSVFRRPLKSLKGFDRLHLSPKEEKTISFNLPVNELAVWDSYRSCFCVETGTCTVMIGASSADIRLTGLIEIQGENPLPRKISGIIYAETFDDYKNCFLHEKRGSGIPAVFNEIDGGWIKFLGLDFQKGISNFSAIVQGRAGSRLEIRLGAPDGILAGSIEIPNTGDFCSYPAKQGSPQRLPVWAYVQTSIKNICGLHDLFIVLYGKTGIWNFNFLKEKTK
jgi:beta-glucosidase